MKKIFSIAVISFITTMTHAQSIEKNVLGTSGKTVVVNNITLDYTVGEVFTSTLTSANNSITQGFHQSNLIVARMAQNENGEMEEVTQEQIAEKLSDKTFKQFDMQVFPNPTTDFINLKLNLVEFENLKVTVSTINGQIVNETLMTSTTAKIDFTNFISGTYLITVRNEQGDLNINYRVIKMK